MPLLENGQIIQDTWQIAVEDTPLPAGDVLVPLARLSEGLGRNEEARLGVVLNSADEIEALREALPRLDLVVLSFPVFRDGRPFTQARALREHLHFKGEIRAGGHILPDQYEFLLRCGVTTVSLPEGVDLSVWQHAHEAFTVAYQPSILNEQPEGFAFRRRLA
ncbi:DUF934 domain-containing protein [Acetobacter orleanensis]|uniref:Oxidoreductase n=1 Tax=Acetobacter orleanensis TaxID=104099 RepID=A0A4Y3TIS1_9PROT|nr:DUF934 domain-containing protein [Acetobacter orleanensis]KXV61973.1 hypothetical protein AD949_11920 [Acetobacter orleanensis]PCD80306.1 DUF934 domain-containing protein [Acetobacter orleanensis]GAN68948.1 hypothetical protein Abol_024_087 [Acetobacter orleanensis JCM 7639]GBR30643.1 hypothetical protein AA0473_2316 [Acetobacter orleanensis NRIC 0473]GEB81644.1 oxidoreductase [Acetobacter orleanensis]